MAANLKSEQRQHVEEEAWRLRVKGWLIPRIAQELGVDKSTISRALDRVEKRLAEQFKNQAEVIKARQTERLEHIYSEAMEQWERSCQDAELTRTVTKTLAKATSDYDAENDEPLEKVIIEETVTTERKGQSGNPALLQQAKEALADQREIWSLNAAKKTDVTSAGQPLHITEVVIELQQEPEEPEEPEEPTDEPGDSGEPLAG